MLALDEQQAQEPQGHGRQWVDGKAEGILPVLGFGPLEKASIVCRMSQATA